MMFDNDKPSVDQSFAGLADNLHNRVQDCQKHDATTYSYTARVINDVDNEYSGKIVVTARNDQTGKLIMNISQNLKDVRENGLQLPSLNQLITADGKW